MLLQLYEVTVGDYVEIKTTNWKATKSHDHFTFYTQN